MNIKLKWANRNTTPVTIKIYRNETQVPNDQLVNPIATLEGAVTEYIDTTAVRHKTYYYVIETTNGTLKSYSLPKKVVADFSNGPGPRDLIWGDSNYGYFGTLESASFLGAAEICSALIPSLLAALGANPVPQWHKWIRRGKVCFVPAQPIAAAATMPNLYNAGLVHGMDNIGPWQPGVAGVNQLKTIQKGYEKFIVRLPTGSDDRTDQTRTIPSSGNTPDIRRYSELSDMYYPILKNMVPTSQRAPNVEAAVLVATMAQGRQIATCTMFGTLGSLQGCPSVTATTSTELEAIGGYASWATSLTWVPLLELVPQPPTVEI